MKTASLNRQLRKLAKVELSLFNGKPQASVRFDAGEDLREMGWATMTVLTPFEQP